ncbi:MULTISPECIES: hypothetical protein [Tenacibaculum]|uniref:Lipocalin-like domain-containing protein n=2 Tax=Tenacibaculum TaxID=104267 RepID=A0AAE9MR92_9FLAO|nr:MULTISPECIES: hypothetical protein [Tenacibaculum]GFD76095.1 hypothetical protein KUL113_55150 [Tenacibaculum sp. KUL113]GFD83926.1 hypothetical protein KUL118_67880 [Tenacibaculum sp. KUL118]GFD93845.1 hypothetical protein KUL154_25780 [Alteromonas sp. KUL154]GFE03435.1 hypothetical protein KUL156_60270 [Alteromonas sp. KUL156]MCG7503166.1 hypothetical protein [Tenacibaculum sp. Mcav3-52]
MKNLIKLLSILGVVLLTVTACSESDDPKDNDLFVGTYEGSVSYDNGENSISAENGSVTVAKTGDTYNFIFSDDIPSISGLEIEKGENKFELDWDEASLIVIDESSLNIKMAKDGKSWSANCKR